MEKQFPRATQEFKLWIYQNFRVLEDQYNDAISSHRYTIAARFFGYPTEPPAYAMEDVIEQKIIEMISKYQEALDAKIKDPLKTLGNLSFDQRNEFMEKNFQRKTLPAIHDFLIPLTNFILPSLFDTLIPYQGRSSIFGPRVTAEKPDLNQDTEYNPYAVTPEMDKEWIDNIEFSWKIRTEDIPF